MRSKIIPFMVLIILMQNCGRANLSRHDLDIIKSNTWEWDSGFKVGVGDMLDFDINDVVFGIRGDTIYYNGEPKALIKSLSKKNMLLMVTSLNRQQTGYYINIEEFTR